MRLSKILTRTVVSFALLVLGLAACGEPEPFHADEVEKTAQATQLGQFPNYFSGPTGQGSAVRVPTQSLTCSDGTNIPQFFNGPSTRIFVELMKPGWIQITMTPPFGSGELQGRIFAKYRQLQVSETVSSNLPYPNQLQAQNGAALFPQRQVVDAYFAQLNYDGDDTQRSWLALLPGIRNTFDSGATQNPVVNGNQALLGGKSAWGIYVGSGGTDIVTTGYVWLVYPDKVCQVLVTATFFPQF